MIPQREQNRISQTVVRQGIVWVQLDRTLKLAWYKRYGVRECWLVDPKEERVEVVDLQNDVRKSFSGKTPIVSRVLPEFAVAAERCFE